LKKYNTGKDNDRGADILSSAVIDMGSNTVRLCIFDFSDGAIETVLSQKKAVGLAGCIRDRELEPDGITRVCEALKFFRSLALKFVSERDIHIFATAALRGVTNKSQALGAIHAETGLLPEILSGDEEAYLDFVGVTFGVELSDGFLIDIGGASTEFVRFSGGEPKKKTSLPVGCLGLYSGYMRGPLVSGHEKKSMLREIRGLFDTFDWNGDRCSTLIGVGGTVRAALKLSTVLFDADRSAAFFPAENVRLIRKMLENNSPGVFHALYKAAPDRALTIYPGLLILEEAVQRLGCVDICVSKHGVREGFYIDRVLKLHGGGSDCRQAE
jgi:exopolyphosphatase/guanosine-5'-triphosphate,3'-diphosphate pyrophosphatase